MWRSSAGTRASAQSLGAVLSRPRVVSEPDRDLSFGAAAFGWSLGGKEGADAVEDLVGRRLGGGHLSVLSLFSDVAVVACGLVMPACEQPEGRPVTMVGGLRRQRGRASGTRAPGHGW